MKVLMIEHFGGENPYSYSLCKSLSEMNIELTVISTTSFIGSNCTFKVLRYYPAFEKCPKVIKIARYIKALVKTAEVIITGKYDVVHFQTFRRYYVEWILFLAISHFYKNTVLTCHNIYPHEKTRYSQFVFKQVYRSAVKIIVHNTFAYDALASVLNSVRQKMFVIPHGNYDYYKTIGAGGNAKKINAEAEHGELKLMMFGVMREYKGLDILLRAFSRIQDTNVKLTVCGRAKPGYRMRHELLARQLNIMGRVIFDWREVPEEQVASVISDADILVYPYRNIYQSGALMLAYTFGKPVIVSRAEGFRDEVINNINGYVLDFGSDNELSALTGHILHNKEELKNMGRYNEVLAYTKYSWNGIALKTCNIYKMICSKNSKKIRTPIIKSNHAQVHTGIDTHQDVQC